MAIKSALGVQPPRKAGRSPSRSPNPKNRKAFPAQSANYASEGVTDNDIFNLPSNDYKALVVVTLIAAVVRLFRIYQPSSVVFDEVQYVMIEMGHTGRAC